MASKPAGSKPVNRPQQVLRALCMHMLEAKASAPYNIEAVEMTGRLTGAERLLSLAAVGPMFCELSALIRVMQSPDAYTIYVPR